MHMNDKVRQDFTFFRKHPEITYLDSACVSLKPIAVLEAMQQYYDDFPACAGRSNHRLADQVTEAVAQARKAIASFIRAKEEEIIFTKNTTEGINLVAHGLDLQGKTVLSTDKEHNSNLVPWLYQQEKGKCSHAVLPSFSDNSFNLDAYASYLATHDVGLVSVHHISNLDGMQTPIKKIVSLAHQHGALVLVDAAQTAAHHEIDVRSWDADFIAFSGHKMLGPSGTGVLYGKKKRLAELSAFCVGGDTVSQTTYTSYTLKEVPSKFEAGLQNYAGIIGLGAAASYLQTLGMQRIERHITSLNRYLTEGLSSLPLQIIGNHDPAQRSSIYTFFTKNVPHHQINLLLNQQKIMARSGAFCVHSWFAARHHPGAVRFSFGPYSTLADCDAAIAAINKVIKPLL